MDEEVKKDEEKKEEDSAKSDQHENSNTKSNGKPPEVTGDPKNMKQRTYSWLAVWFIFLGVGSIIVLIKVWPPVSTIEKMTMKINSLTRQINDVSTVINMKPSDTAITKAKVILGDTTKAKQNETPKTSETQEQDDQGTSYFLIALFSGLLGGSLHALSSLMDFRGQQRLFGSWSLWYFALPLTGGMLSLIVFFILRAGIFPNASPADIASPYGVAAFGALTGMFTDKATNKIAELVDVLFMSPTSKNRTDKLVANNASTSEQQHP